MKSIWLPALFSLLVAALSGCSGTGNDNTTHVNPDYVLENLLGVPDEAALIDKYGEEHVQYDTIWGAEGYFSMGTILQTEPQSHIEITWQNEQKKTGIVSVTLVSDENWYADSIDHGMWISATGVRLGMTLEQLQQINGRAFTFSGFGWDYAGTVTDWKKGNLEGKGIAVQLAEGSGTRSLNDTETRQVLGDIAVESDNPVAVAVHPRVWSISVAKTW